jgi:hypothetical protein
VKKKRAMLKTQLVQNTFMAWDVGWCVSIFADGFIGARAYIWPWCVTKNVNRSPVCKLLFSWTSQNLTSNLFLSTVLSKSRLIIGNIYKHLACLYFIVNIC